MNTQALHQLLDTATSMFDHALSTFQEMRALDARSLQDESPEEQTKRRRLKALRWAFIMSIAYGGYRLIRRLLRKRQHQRQLSMYPARSNSSSIQVDMQLHHAHSCNLQYNHNMEAVPMALLPMQCQILILPIMELVVHLPCIQVVPMAATFKPLILANHQKHHALTRASNQADKQGEH